jgi:hypothetical protein
VSTPEETPSASRQPSEQELVESIYNFAAQELNNGVSPEMVEQRLVAHGLPAEAAATVVNGLVEARSNAHKKAGQRNMLIGGLVCVVGLIVTIVTYSNAVAGGGTYVVAWGAILFGAVQFFQGIYQSSQS